MDPKLEALLLLEEMLIFNKELEEVDKYATFGVLRREFEEQQLLREINEDETTTK